METPRRIGLSLFLLVFGVFGVWAAIAPLDGAAYAPGSVTVKSYSQVVQHLEGGIIREIRAQDGDRVAAGEPLLIIDDTQALAQLGMARAQFIALATRNARLSAERDRLGQVSYPATIQLNGLDAGAEMAAQTEIFRARRAALDGSVEVLEQRERQLRSKLTGLAAQKAAKEELSSSYGDELDDVSELLSQGFSNKTRLRELERNFTRLKGEAAELSAAISSTEVEIGEARLQILQLQREFHNEVVNQLSETQTALTDMNERINALGDIVKRTVVRAPVAGIVNGLRFHTEGGVISPGNPIAEIVPQSVDLIVTARVSPNDIDRVSLGQDTSIRFSTFGSSVPTIFGRILTLSANSLSDEATGIAYYEARVEVTEEGLASLGDLVLLPGMPADVFIATGSRTLLQYLFKPFSNAIARSLIED
jgi:epimerase transport system membrane fusion protein